MNINNMSPMMPGSTPGAVIKSADIKVALSAFNAVIAPAKAVLVATVESTTDEVTNLELISTDAYAARVALKTIT